MPDSVLAHFEHLAPKFAQPEEPKAGVTGRVDVADRLRSLWK